LNFAVTIALGSLPRVLFGPISGVVADRFDRKKLVVYLDILSGFVVLALLSMSYLDSLRLSYIYIATFLLTTCSTFFNTPLGSSIPNLVDDDNLTKVNSLSQSIESISSIAGPAIGGVIFYLVDMKLFLLVNGLSFVFSGISEMFIDFNIRDKFEKKDEICCTEEEVAGDEEKKSVLEDFKEGIKFIVSRKWLVIMASFSVLLNMITMIGLAIPVPYIVNEQWKFTAQQYGILSMTFPIGMLVGSLILSILPEAKKNFKRMMICLFIVSVITCLIGLVTSEMLFTLTNGYYLIILMVLYSIMAVSLIFFNVPYSVTLQRLIPDEKRGRVFGTLGTMSAALTPIGAIIGGFLVDRISPWKLPISCGIVMLVLTVVMYNTQELKEI